MGSVHPCGIPEPTIPRRPPEITTTCPRAPPTLTELVIRGPAPSRRRYPHRIHYRDKLQPPQDMLLD